MVSLALLDRVLHVDAAARTVTVEPGARVEQVGACHGCAVRALPYFSRCEDERDAVRRLAPLDVKTGDRCEEGGVRNVTRSTSRHRVAERHSLAAAASRVARALSLGQVLEALRPHGLTLPNLASIAQQQIGGFVQVGAHGTGARVPPCDEQVGGTNQGGAPPTQQTKSSK